MRKRLRLSTRLMVYALGALALVLLGFSATIYLTAAKYLDRQTDDRLEGAVNTLTAAAEIGPDLVEWEPQERELSFGRRTVEGSLAWSVSDPTGKRIDGASPASATALLDNSMPADLRSRSSFEVSDPRRGTWRVMYRRLEPTQTPTSTRGEPGQAAAEVEPEPAHGKHKALLIGAAVSTAEMRSTLRNLELVLIGLTSTLWTLALVSGRRLCERALKPLTEMALAAHAIAGHEVEEQLPSPQSDDEIGELGRSFNGLLHRLRESYERQRRFTGDASHQLRTPLTAMQGQVDLALRKERSPSEYHDVLTRVQKKIRHLRQIVESLVFLARADGEAIQPQSVLVDLDAWLPDRIRSWLDPRARLDLSIEISSPGPHTVRAQPELLGELLENLLDNAGKYSDPGTPIVVRLTHDGPSVLLSVEDRGIGIDESELPHLFEPFYRSPSILQRSTTGLGLGLSVASRIARALGGEIGVASQLDAGTIFTLRLPLETQDQPATEPANSNQPPLQLDPSLKRATATTESTLS